MFLNIGCGDKIVPNAVNVDLRPLSGGVIQHDLNVMPWPIESASMDDVYAMDIIEHLRDAVSVIDECWRVLKPGGKLHIRTACWNTRQSFTDPTHIHWFNEESFDFFDPTTHWGSKYGWYTDRKWRVLERGKDGEELVFTMWKEQ